MLRAYEKLLKDAHPGVVVVAMLKGKMGLLCSEKTRLRAFRAHGIHFKPLYEKPTIDKGTVAKRLERATTNLHRSPTQWNRFIHAVIGNKVFPM